MTVTSTIAGVTVLAAAVAGIGPAAAPAAHVSATSKPRPTCEGKPATIVGARHITGTEGADVIVGSSRRDLIDAKGGNDLICSLGGHDVIRDGKGRDRIYGGTGEDFLAQESIDRDLFDGGPGFDAIDYTPRTQDQYFNLRDRKANDGVRGEHDRLLSVGSVYAGSGDDMLIAGREPNTDVRAFPASSAYFLVGEAGDDVLIGGPLGDLLVGGEGHDVVRGRGGRDFLEITDVDANYEPQPFPDVADGGKDDEPDDVAVCDELDTVTRVTDREGC
jgi:Ca2+-binding RTX toxin-like protein